MDADFFVQGTGNRFLICLFEIDPNPIKIDHMAYYDITGYSPPGGPTDRVNVEIADNLHRFYRKLHEQDMVWVYPADDAKKLMGDYIEMILNDSKTIYLKDPKSLLYSYRGGLELTVNKLMLLVQMSKEYQKFLEDPSDFQERVIIGSLESAEDAIKLCESYYSDFVRMYSDWTDRSFTKEEPLWSDSNLSLKLKRQIDRMLLKLPEKEGFVNRNKLRQNLHISEKQLETLESSYLERKVISTGGRHSVLVRWIAQT